MNWRDISPTKWALSGRRIGVYVTFASAILPLGAVAGAQTTTARDTATAYGARLNAKGEPADVNPNRINNRVNSRLDTRLSLRIERYRTDNIDDPAAAFAVKTTDNARVGTDTTLSPLTSSSRASLGSVDNVAGPR